MRKGYYRQVEDAARQIFGQYGYEEVGLPLLESTPLFKRLVGEADLTETNAVLNDDRLYLKDLTSKCETKAKEWDQRSQMRADELTALSKALGIMQDRVKTKDEQANKRAAALVTRISVSSWARVSCSGPGALFPLWLQ